MHTLLHSDRIAILARMGHRVNTTVAMATARTLALNTKCSLVFRTNLFVVDTEGSGAIIMVRFRIAASQDLGLQITVSMLQGVGVGIFRTFNGQLVAGVEDAARPTNHKVHYINLDSLRAPHRRNPSPLSKNKHLNLRMTIIPSDHRRTSKSKIRVEMRLVRKTMVLAMARKCLLLLDNLQRVHNQRKGPNSVLLSRQRPHLHLQQRLCQTLCKR